MKTHALLSLSVSLLLLQPAARADITLVQDTLLNGVSSRSTMWIKGDKVRTDNDTTTTMIMDTSSGEMTTLMHEQKMKITTNTKQLQALAAAAGGAPAAGGAEAAVTKVTATGQKEKVEGYDCEIYLSENQGMVVKLWVTQDYPNQEKLREEMKVMAKMAAPGAPKQPEVPGIAVKTEFEQQGLKFTTKLISLTMEPVDAAKFVIPEGYKAP